MIGPFAQGSFRVRLHEPASPSRLRDRSYWNSRSVSLQMNSSDAAWPAIPTRTLPGSWKPCLLFDRTGETPLPQLFKRVLLLMEATVSVVAIVLQPLGFLTSHPSAVLTQERLVDSYDTYLLRFPHRRSSTKSSPKPITSRSHSKPSTRRDLLPHDAGGWAQLAACDVVFDASGTSSVSESANGYSGMMLPILPEAHTDRRTALVKLKRTLSFPREFRRTASRQEDCLRVLRSSGYSSCLF